MFDNQLCEGGEGVNLGLEACVGGSRIFREDWVSDFACRGMGKAAWERGFGNFNVLKWVYQADRSHKGVSRLEIRVAWKSPFWSYVPRQITRSLSLMSLASMGLTFLLLCAWLTN